MDADKFLSQLVLDSTDLYQPHPNYTVIQTQTEWLKMFDHQSSKLWIKGEIPCAWAEAFLKGRRRWDSIDISVKQPPSQRLSVILHPEPIPQDWSSQDIFQLVSQLDQYDPNDPIPYFLAEKTGSDLVLWQSSPSPEHLAQWLTISVPKEYRLLEQVWQFRHSPHKLGKYYSTDNKLELLRNWLGIGETPLEELGTFPIEIPDLIREEFDRFWEKRLLLTEGSILDGLPLHAQAGRPRIIDHAYQLFLKRPQLYTRDREQKLAPYLSQSQKLTLYQQIPPAQPLPLKPEATETEALDWATKEYLPFRRWEIVSQKRSQDDCISTQLAQSFIDWLLKKYGSMISAPVPQSFLNYSAGSIVFDLAQDNPVLWVVVDGLGWLDHQDLLEELKSYGLQLQEQVHPKFSILPTLTEYAKWSLFSQLPPTDPSWVEDAGRGFPSTPLGRRYTDNMHSSLLKDLRIGNQRLYCLDTVEFDKLNHHAGDWRFLYETQRPSSLRSIATQISALVNEFPNPDELNVVIASDHGQMLGECSQISPCPNDLSPKERLAEGEVDDPRFVVLRPEEFPVPKTISIVLGAETLSSYQKSRPRLGAHGGLFPEEVVVGVSMLKKHVQRKLPLVICQGEGRPGEAGELFIIVDNLEKLWMEDLWLQVNEIPDLVSGTSIAREIPSNQRSTIKLSVKYPEVSNPNGNIQTLTLSGTLTFRYRNAESVSVDIDSSSSVEVKVMFSSGLDIDEFL